MKNIKYIILFILTYNSFSCVKLNTLPTDFVTDKNYYKTEAELNIGLTGIYSILGHAALYQDALLHNMSYSNDEGVFVYTQPALIAPANFGYAVSEPAITDLCIMLDRGINHANVLLRAMDGEGSGNVDESKKQQLKAQTLFLRADYYFM